MQGASEDLLREGVGEHAFLSPDWERFRERQGEMRERLEEKGERGRCEKRRI